MKTTAKGFLFFTIFLLLMIGGLSAQQISLDETITRAARGVEEVLPQGTKVAVLNFASPTEAFSDYVIEELTGKLVTGQKVTIVDRRNLALISQEMNLQLSGDVSDDSAQAIGRMLGAQSIVSGTLTNMGTFYRFRVRVINVETAAIQTQVSLDMRNDTQVAFLLSGSPVSATPSVSDGTTSSGTTIEGTIVPGNKLTEKLAWLQRSADSHNTYILEVNANENISPTTFEYKGAIDITIVLRGTGANRTIRLSSNGAMFIVRSNVTLVLENNITLNGHNNNNRAMVVVEGGTFRMNNGSAIIDNNNNGRNAGGVSVNSGTFSMNGGTISGNSSAYGGGVYVSRGTFTMNGGTISGNIVSKNGGGVDLSGGTFTMSGGTITGNTARVNGGGVSRSNGTFNKGGGIITGYNSDQNNGNVVKDEFGNVIARRGHAAFVNENRRKETTAEQGVNLSSSNNRGWDN